MLYHWRVLALVCAFSGLVAFKPSEPFIVVFLRCVKQRFEDDRLTVECVFEECMLFDSGSKHST